MLLILFGKTLLLSNVHSNFMMVIVVLFLQLQTYQVDLKPNGSEIMVTNENKREYIEYVYADLQPFIKLNKLFG